MDGGSDLWTGPDGLTRCWWADAGPLMARYHDEEWARGPRDEQGLFERLSLEALQAGLSWRIVLERRDALRTAYLGFDPAALADGGPETLERILTAPGSIRNRSKVTAILSNATTLMRLHAGGTGLKAVTEAALAANPHRPPAVPRRRRDVPALTAGSTALAARLRELGWRFVGPTTAYAYLQAAGWVNDHLVGCHARAVRGADRAPGDRTLG